MSTMTMASRSTGLRGGQGLLNTALMTTLSVAVVLAPMPFGSSRPLYWAVWASFIGAVALIYGAALSLGRHRWRLPARDTLPAVIFFMLGIGFIGVQLIPFGSFPIVVEGGQLSTPQISVAPDMTLLSLLKQATYGLFVFLVMQAAINGGRRQRASYVLLFAVLAYAAYGIYSLQSGDSILGIQKWAYLGSATSTFVNRNSFATFLGLGAVIALARGCSIIVAQSERHRDDGHIKNLASSLLLHLLAYLFLLTVIVATQSRMGLAATMAGSVALIVLTLATTRKIRHLTLIFPVVVAVVAVSLLLYGDGLLSRLGNDQLSTSNRILIYQQALDLVRQRPLTGFGGGTFEQAFQLVHRLPLSPEYVWSHAHNTYLTLWSEFGLVFGSLPMLALAYFGWRMLRGIGRRSTGWAAQATGLGAITVGAVHSLADFSLEIPGVTFLFLALVAMGVAASTASE